jgi:hypothetical protein
VGRVFGLPGFDHFNDADPEVQEAESRDGPPDVGVPRELEERLAPFEKQIPIPETGPRQDQQHEARLEEERRDNEPTGQSDYPPAWTRERRSTRRPTSR